MKVHEHLLAFHKASHGHHVALVQAHELAFKKIEGMDDETHAPSLKFHKAAAASHQQMADYHEGAMREISKAAADAMNKIASDGVRGVIPPAQRVTPIVRAGQREITDSPVPLEFEKLVSIED